MRSFDQRDGHHRSVVIVPWAEEVSLYLLRAAAYPNRASLYTPAMAALLAATIRSIEARSTTAEGAKLAKEGRELLNEYIDRDPSYQAAINA